MHPKDTDKMANRSDLDLLAPLGVYDLGLLCLLSSIYPNPLNPLYNDIRYNSKIRYNINLVCTKISGLHIFSLIFPCYSSGKHTFCVFVRIA